MIIFLLLIYLQTRKKKIIQDYNEKKNNNNSLNTCIYIDKIIFLNQLLMSNLKIKIENHEYMSIAMNFFFFKLKI